MIEVKREDNGILISKTNSSQFITLTYEQVKELFAYLRLAETFDNINKECTDD